jgi:hypothetical protein
VSVVTEQGRSDTAADNWSLQILGGGGGGAARSGSTSVGGTGGSGIVILKYLVPVGTTVTHIYKGSGSWVAPEGVTAVDWLVVAGGGGGGAAYAGGGGAGGFRTGTGLSVTAGTTYTVTVGAGGTGSPGAERSSMLAPIAITSECWH